MTGHLTHVDGHGAARMVDISDKSRTARRAVAAGEVRMLPSTAALIVSGSLPKGDVLQVARVAAIMAAKKTPGIIPLCHSIALASVEVNFDIDQQSGVIVITAEAAATDTTGVEMEALTAVSAAALTIYDMCKAVQKDMTITSIRLISKTGGKSGDFVRNEL